MYTPEPLRAVMTHQVSHDEDTAQFLSYGEDTESGGLEKLADKRCKTNQGNVQKH